MTEIVRTQPPTKPTCLPNTKINTNNNESTSSGTEVQVQPKALRLSITTPPPRIQKRKRHTELGGWQSEREKGKHLSKLLKIQMQSLLKSKTQTKRLWAGAWIIDLGEAGGFWRIIMSLNQSVIRPQVALKVWKLKLQNRKTASGKVDQVEDDESSGHQKGA